MSAGLNLGDVVNVQIVLAPPAAQGRNFGNAMIVGSSPVIDTTTRFRLYSSLAAIGVDFGTSAQEYAAATRYFGQSPQPQQVYIGRWAQSATPAQIFGAPLSALAQSIATWNAVTAGAFFIVIDGIPYAINCSSFAAQSNLNGVALLIQSALNNAELTTTDIAALTTAQVNALTTAQIPPLPTGIIGALTTQDIVALSTGQVSALQTSQINVLTSAQILQLSTADIAALSTNQIAALTAREVVNATNPVISCVWNSTYSQFIITDVIQGASSTFSFLGAPTAVGNFSFGITQPTANDTIVIGGTTVTFVSALTTGNQILIGATVPATIQNALAFLQSSTNTNLLKFNYYATPTNLYLSAVTPGTGGNSLTISSTGSTPPLASGATLTGGSGTDISSMMGMRSTSTGAYVVNGIAAESLLTCVNTLANMSNNWYGLYNADVIDAQVSDYVAVAGFIEAANPSRIFAITSQDPNTLVTNNQTSLAYQLFNAKYNRSFVQYSSLDPQAGVSELGRLLTVNPLGNNTTITLKFKQEPGVLAETLNETQAAALNAINCNVFVNYNNSTAIVQQGTMASGQYIDTIWGLDWLQNYTQTNVYNVLYGSPTKIPQTDAGVNQLVSVVNSSCQQAVTNGFLAPGVWTGPPIGSVNTGDTLTTGYYVFANPISTQSSAQRAARQAPPIQACLKLAGAIHSANVIMNVNQ